MDSLKGNAEPRHPRLDIMNPSEFNLFGTMPMPSDQKTQPEAVRIEFVDRPPTPDDSLSTVPEFDVINDSPFEVFEVLESMSQVSPGPQVNPGAVEETRRAESPQQKTRPVSDADVKDHEIEDKPNTEAGSCDHESDRSRSVTCHSDDMNATFSIEAPFSVARVVNDTLAPLQELVSPLWRTYWFEGGYDIVPEQCTLGFPEQAELFQGNLAVHLKCFV